MPTPLPSIDVPDYGNIIQAQRLGEQDQLARDKRELMKSAGGLAAAGNYKGAQSALYKGGEFDEARQIAAELRARAGEARAASSHSAAMQDRQLERQGKTYELFGRLIPTIKTPEQLEMAKAMIKQRTGMDFSQVTMEQLPMLYQQNLSIEQGLKMQLEQARADREKFESDRTYDLNARKADIAERAVSARANKPAALTEGQRKAQSYLDVMKDASESVKSVLPSDEAESPMGTVSSAISGINDEVAAKYRSKEQNQFMQSAEQWVIAKLRHQSGATISPDEIRKEMRIFWPVPGDDIQTRRNKAKARARVERSLGFEATGEVAGAPSQGNNIGSMSNQDILKELGLE